MNDNISDKDKKDWDKFVNSTEKLPNKDFQLKKNKNLNVRSIDLHGYTLDDANKTIEDFIKKAFSENVNRLIIVTGKGLHSTSDNDAYVSKDFSKLKYSVPDFIKSDGDLNKFVFSVSDADIKDGGEGAILVKLRNL